MLLWGHDQEVRDFVSAHFSHVLAAGGFHNGYAAGLTERGRLVGGVLLTHVTTFDGHITVAFDSARVLTPDTLDKLFRVPFRHLCLRRLTALVDPKNKRCRRLLEGLGFSQEGKLRRGLDGRRDAIVYGMLAEECRWIRE